MHPLCARFVPRRNILLCVLPCKSLLMVRLAPLQWARCGRVTILDIKPASEANIPICVLFGGVRKFGASGRQCRGEPTVGGCRPREQGHSGHRDKSLGRWGLLTAAHVVRKGGALSIVSPTTSASSPTATATASATSALMKCTSRCAWNVHRLDRGDMVGVALSGRW